MKLTKRLFQVLMGLLMVGTLSGMLMLSACSGDDEGVSQPVPVAFINVSGQVMENATFLFNVNMIFAEPVREAGTIEITVTNGANTTSDNYILTPAPVAGKITLNIAAGAQQAAITVDPVDNDVVDGNKTVIFTITNVTGGLQIGTNDVFTLTILDDDTEADPVEVNFAEAARTIAENSAATTVTLNFADEAPAGGTISVAVANAEGTTAAHYTTNPAIVAGRIELTVAAGATSTSFTVTPVDNSEVDDDKQITFTIVETSAAFAIGTADQFVLTIENDDVAPTVMSIADLRALHTGSNVTIPDNTFIEAVLSSTNQNVTARNAWFQDETGGILIRFTANNAIERGRNVRVNVGGASLELFSGVLQVGGSAGIANALVEDLGAGTLPTPQVITIEQLRSDEFQGLLVKIENVSFPAADGTRNLRYDGGSGQGNNVFTDGTNQGVLRVESYAPFATAVLPLGAGDVYGIASRFNDVFQITPQVPEDIFASNATAEITVTGGPFTFGEVANGEQSAPETFSVGGQDLLGDITVTAPAQFQVSLASEGPFSSSVMVEKEAAEAGQVQVYVVFKPTSEVDGVKEGNISLTSLGAEPKSVAVSGTETGNAGGPSPGGIVFEESPYVIDFDGIEDGLPFGITTRTGATSTTLGTIATPTLTKVLWNNSSGAFKNFASGTGLESTANSDEQNASTNRALGLRQTAGVGDPGGAFVFEINNTEGKTNLSLEFLLQSLDATGTNTRVTTWTVDFGIGDSPENFTSVAATSGTLTTTASSFTSSEIKVDFPASLNNVNAKVWVRIVTLTTTTGGGSRASSAIDDVKFTWE
jgi:hypothetical protein